MVNLTEIRMLVQQGESETLEFKKSTAQLKEALMTLCAFLNHRGGYVFIGVNPKGELIGQNISDATRQEVAYELTKIEPSAQADLEIAYLAMGKEKWIIIMQAKPGSHIPYAYEGRALDYKRFGLRLNV